MERLFTLGIVVAALLGFSTVAQEFTCLERNSGELKSQILGSSERYDLTDVPWMVNLSYGAEPFCGGSLVNNTTVLTAAHCVDDDITVRRVDGSGSPYGEELKVLKYKIHPDYAPDEQGISHNDLALLKLDGAFDVSINELPRLQSPESEDSWGQAGDCSFLAGWGTTKEGGNASDVLLGADLPLWSAEECKASYEEYYDENSSICAGYKEGGIGSCKGDSGGALLVRGGPTEFIQVGIVSFGKGCARPNYPTVYTRVSSFYDWIFEAAEELSN